MNKFLKLPVTIALLFVVLVTAVSCKKSFDQPPSYIDPNLVANKSIAALKAMHASGGYEAINTDIIISGTVIADDKSGNLYKELYIQDATGGIAIEMDGTNLYTQFPVGRKVFIKCKGLYLSDYAGMIQLGVLDASIPGNPSLAGIPYTLFDTYIARGTYNNPISVTTTTVAGLSTNSQGPLLGTLVKLEGFEFSNGDIARTFADTSSAKNSFDLYIKNCSGSSIDVRTSGYANFAGQHPPSGNGSIIALYTVYGTSKQLILRDPSEINFTGPRCNLFEEDFSSIGANGQTLSLPNWKNIQEVGSSANSLFQNAVFGSTPIKCAKVSAFSTGGAVTTWLISPAINLAGTTTPKLAFYTSAGFISALTPQFRVYISTTYPGSGTPSTYFTTQLSASIAVPPASGFSSFLYSGLINLSAYAGQTIYIAYRYDGNDPSGTGSDATATYEVDDIAVTRQ